MRVRRSRQTRKSRAEAPTYIQVYPMFSFLKYCFSRTSKLPPMTCVVYTERSSVRPRLIKVLLEPHKHPANLVGAA
jgi:hypothetical protein